MQTDNILDSWAIGLLYFVAAVSPSLILFSGPALAASFVIVALFPTIIGFRKKIWGQQFDLTIYKIVIVVLAYSLLSAIWAIDSQQSFKLWYRMVLFFIGFICLFEYVKALDIRRSKQLAQILTVGFVIALLAANIEILADGVLTKFFRSFQSKEHIFKLTDLNRGASYLCIIFWPVFAYLLLNKHKILALIILLLSVFTLFRLESQSSSMAIILSLIACGFIAITGKKGASFMMFAAIIAVAFVAITAKLMNPAVMFEIIPNIPNSASEIRLYIWDFAAQKAGQKPILGWGFDASRSIEVSESEYVMGGRHPLPLHPHNNVLQIWLELGVVGLCLFAAFLVAIIARIRDICAITNSNCRTHFDQAGGYLSRIYTNISENTPMALVFGLFAAYFAIGQTGYGIWQNWWVAGGLLAVCFIKNAVRWRV